MTSIVDNNEGFGDAPARVDAGAPALLIARFPGDPNALQAAYDRAHQLILAQSGPPFGELRHHCARSEDALYLVGVWQSEAHITRRFGDPAFCRLLQSADFPLPTTAELTILRLHTAIPPIDTGEQRR
jgi:hypothetical protein